MGFIASSLEVKTCITEFHRKKETREKPQGSTQSEFANASELDPYIYANLYLPILRYGMLNLNDLDFSRITQDDIAALAKLFRRTTYRQLETLSVVFRDLEPAAANENIFI